MCWEFWSFKRYFKSAIHPPLVDIPKSYNERTWQIWRFPSAESEAGCTYCRCKGSPPGFPSWRCTPNSRHSEATDGTIYRGWPIGQEPHIGSASGPRGLATTRLQEAVQGTDSEQEHHLGVQDKEPSRMRSFWKLVNPSSPPLHKASLGVAHISLFHRP